jgi:hypothetical protein
MGSALGAQLGIDWVMRLSNEDVATVAIGFSVRIVALPMAIAVTILNRIEYAVFAVIYFLSEAPRLPGALAVYWM